jgi:hypothetical protein
MNAGSESVKRGILKELQVACSKMPADPLFRGALGALVEYDGVLLAVTLLCSRDDDEQRWHVGFFHEGAFSARESQVKAVHLASSGDTLSSEFRRDQGEAVLKGILGSFVGAAWCGPVPYV